MVYRRRTSAKRPPKKPADAASGVLSRRKFMLKLYDREDGKAADWPLIAETLLREAFHALDQMPDERRTLTLLRQVHSESYDRLAGNQPATDAPLRQTDHAPFSATSLNLPPPDHPDRV
jgi:DNA-directed RNA polymerase specialized sigma24 family protein